MTDKIDPISLQCADIVMSLEGCFSDVPFFSAAEKVSGLVEGLEAELQAARADLREAMELLRAHGQPPDWLKLGDAADWNTRYGKLLAKHKEAEQ